MSIILQKEDEKSSNQYREFKSLPWERLIKVFKFLKLERNIGGTVVVDGKNEKMLMLEYLK